MLTPPLTGLQACNISFDLIRLHLSCELVARERTSYVPPQAPLDPRPKVFVLPQWLVFCLTLFRLGPVPHLCVCVCVCVCESRSFNGKYNHEVKLFMNT